MNKDYMSKESLSRLIAFIICFIEQFILPNLLIQPNLLPMRPCNLSMRFLPPDVDRPYMLVMTRSVGKYLILHDVYKA